MIDWARVVELREEIGAEDFCEVVDLFLEEADDVINRFPDLPEDHVAAALHFLKGMALNLGLSDFAHLCQHGEHSGGPVQRQDLIACYAQSKVEFASGLSLKAA